MALVDKMRATTFANVSTTKPWRATELLATHHIARRQQSWLEYQNPCPRSRSTVALSYQPGQQPPVQQPAPQNPAPLARRQPYLPARPVPATFLRGSDIAGKQVITRTSAKTLGTVSNFWIDPNTLEVVALGLERKSRVSSERAGYVELSSLRQVADVVLVHSEDALKTSLPMQCICLSGLEVRNESGSFYGKVRDFKFSPDNGVLSSLIYDEWGIGFLPVNFFDSYEISVEELLYLQPECITVRNNARERKLGEGLFSRVPRLLGSVTQPATRAALPAVSSAYSDNSLPPNYDLKKWEQDIRLWEQQTGQRYEDYMRQRQQVPRALPPPAATSQLPQQASRYPAQPQYPQYSQPSPGPVQRAPATDPRYRGPPQQASPYAPVQSVQPQDYSRAGPQQRPQPQWPVSPQQRAPAAQPYSPQTPNTAPGPASIPVPPQAGPAGQQGTAGWPAPPNAPAAPPAGWPQPQPAQQQAGWQQPSPVQPQPQAGWESRSAGPPQEAAAEVNNRPPALAVPGGNGSGAADRQPAAANGSSTSWQDNGRGTNAT